MTAEDRPGDACRARSTLQIHECCGAPARIWLHIDDDGRARVSVTADEAATAVMRPDVETTIAYVPVTDLLDRIRQVYDLEIKLAKARCEPAEAAHYRHLLTETCRALDKYFVTDVSSRARTAIDEVPALVRKRLRVAMSQARELDEARRRIADLEAWIASLKGGVG